MDKCKAACRTPFPADLSQHPYIEQAAMARHIEIKARIDGVDAMAAVKPAFATYWSNFS